MVDYYLGLCTDTTGDQKWYIFGFGRFAPSFASYWYFVWTHVHESVTRNPVSRSYNFRKAELINLYNDLLKMDWICLQDIEDVNVACTLLYDKLYSLFR